jgi:tRNAThr (cytosine32-N3)-methyltransferase
LETGAGAGNTAFPILALNKNPRLKIHACDFSKKAVEVIKGNEAYKSEDNVGEIEASVWDVAALPNPETNEPGLPEGIEANSVDVVIMIFIFSALAPSQWEQAVRNIWHVLKPGGVVLFRDYGRGDLAQVRFKKGRWMEDNFYVRGDGTRVYFFEEEELRMIWGGEAATKVKGITELLEKGVASLNFDKSVISEEELNATTSKSRPIFEVLNFGVDRRMLVNRQRRLKMYRCWMQAKFRKPNSTCAFEPQMLGHSTGPSAVQVMATEFAAEQSSEAQQPVSNET